MGEPGLNGPKTKSRRGCLLTCLTISFMGFVLLVVASGALFFWLRGQDVDLIKTLIQIRQGDGSQEQLMTEVTKAMGTGKITMLNLTDEDAWVNIISTNQDGGSSTAFTDLRPFDLQSKAKLPGSYEAQFRLGFDGFGERPPALATCAFVLERDDNYQFIILNDRVLLALEGDESGDDIDTLRSALCDQGENP